MSIDVFPPRTGLVTVTTKATDYTASLTDSVLIGTATLTFTLPAVSGNSGLSYRIKNAGTGTVTVDGDGAEEIDGDTTVTLDVQYESIDVVCDGTEWHIL